MLDDNFFLRVAAELAEQSKCVSKGVGAMLVKDNRIIAMGVNGTLPGEGNCCDVFDAEAFDKQAHREWSSKHELHAEMNCLLFASKHGISTDGCTMYVTLNPCATCLRSMVQAGVRKIIYLTSTSRHAVGAETMAYCVVHNIELTKISEQNVYFTEAECIEQHASKKGVALSKKLKNSIYHHTSHLPSDAITGQAEETNQRMWHLKNRMPVPVCPYTGQYQEYSKRASGYTGVAGKLKPIAVRLNNATCCPWLNLSFLLNDGTLTVEDVQGMLKGKYHASPLFKFRQLFKGLPYDHVQLVSRMENAGFNADFAKTKVMSITDARGLASFIVWLDEVLRIKNNNTTYYTMRGWDENESNSRLLEFFLKGTYSTRGKMAASAQHDDLSRQSRLIGLRTVRAKSKFQLGVRDFFISQGLSVSEDAHVKIDTVHFPNRRFSIDYEVDGCLVEVNCSYWHWDILGDREGANLGRYLREIVKAQDVVKTTGKRYCIIWEHDMKHDPKVLQTIADKIKATRGSNALFISSRALDEQLFAAEKIRDIAYASCK